MALNKKRIQLSKRTLIKKTFLVGAAIASISAMLHAKIIPDAKKTFLDIEKMKMEQLQRTGEFERKTEQIKKNARKHNQIGLKVFSKKTTFDISKLKTSYPNLLRVSKLSHAESREYVLKNADFFAKNYKFISIEDAMHNKKILEPIIKNISKKYGVNPDIMIKLFQKESSWDPFAFGKSKDVGLGQITPIIWDSKTHFQYNCNPLNPIENIEVSIKYFSFLKKKFGNDKLALTAYNSGEGFVLSRLKIGKTVEEIVKSNRNNYAYAVLTQNI